MREGLPLSSPTIIICVGKYNFQAYEVVDFYCYNIDIEKDVWFHFGTRALCNLLGATKTMYWALLTSIQTLII